MYFHIIDKFIFFLKRLLRGPPPPPDTSRLSQLPREVFFLIADELSLGSQFLLSRTCSQALFSLHRDWPAQLRQLPLDERLRYLHLIAYDMPNYVACASCYRLHKVNLADTPSCDRYSLWFGACGIGIRRDYRYVETLHGREHGDYNLGYNHVQLALKYTRLTNAHAKYLVKLMKPYSFRKDTGDKLFPDGRVGAPNISSHYDYRRTETPKIVDGRFLLESVWDVRCRHGRISCRELGWTWPSVCKDHFLLDVTC